MTSVRPYFLNEISIQTSHPNSWEIIMIQHGTVEMNCHTNLWAESVWKKIVKDQKIILEETLNITRSSALKWGPGH